MEVAFKKGLDMVHQKIATESDDTAVTVRYKHVIVDVSLICTRQQYIKHIE